MVASLPPTSGETFEEGEALPRSVVPLRPHLFLVIEGDRPSAGGARHSLGDVEEVVIGRGTARGSRREVIGGRKRLVVQIPGGWMSSAHARLACVRGGWVLEDMGSRNGTWLRGERIERTALADGDVFEAGHSVFAFREALPTPPSTPDDLDTAELTALPPGLRTLLPSLAPSLDELTRVARTEVPIVLLGQAGTGKEVLARAAHEISGRRGPFVAVNCGGLSPALVEGLLFSGSPMRAFANASLTDLVTRPPLTAPS